MKHQGNSRRPVAGIDFDNTIVSYDRVFHLVALERGLIDETVAASKIAVRDTLRRVGREDDWTEMQGHVYGACMADAQPFPGAIEVLSWARRRLPGIALVIVSHKTRYPFMGHKYDLHAAALSWMDDVLRDDEGALFGPEDVTFCETKEEKVSAIEAIGCDLFIDDLPEILTAPGFPAATRRFLFDPEGNHVSHSHLERVEGWDEIRPALAQ